MARRGVRWAALLALVASLWVGFAVSTSAASPIYVRSGGDDVQCNGQANVDFSAGVQPNCAVKTVAKAASLADTAGVVQVEAGTYPDAVTIDKALTLKGAQVGVDARTRTGSESTIGAVSISASNVTLDGFTIDGARVQANTPDASILSGVMIENNIFDGYSSVGLPTHAAGNILIQKNLFKNAQPSSESIQIKSDVNYPGGCNGSRVLDNAFVNATNNGGADVNFSCTGSASSNVTISGNTTSGDSGGSSFTAFSGVTGDITLIGNSGTTSGSAIFFFGAVSGSVDIAGNAFVNGSGSAVSIHGLEYTTDPVNTGTFNITGNQFAGNTGGISVGSGALGTGAQVHAHFNEITVSGTNPISNATSTTIDATNNWWGCNTGPNTPGCGTTVGPVTYDPWLTLTISADPATIAPLGYPGNISTISANLTINSAGDDTSSLGHVYYDTTINFVTSDGTLATTDGTTVNGVASTTLTSTNSPSSATVSAILDAQTVSTIVDWPIPAPTEGAHVIVVNMGSPLLRVNAIATPNGGRGGFYFLGSDRTIIFGMRLTNVVVSGNEATITGNGIVRTSRGVRAVSFRINVTASDTTTGGTFEIRLSNGYDSGVIPVRIVDL